MKATNVKKTGGQIDDLVMSLIEAANDKEETVQNIIASSLVNIGIKQPALLLSSCSFYLANHPKLAQRHKVVLLNVVDKVVKEASDSVSEDVGVELIKQAFAELTNSKDASSECQTAATNLIVGLHGKLYHEVMNELLDKFQPGVLPHYFVVQTLADLALANVFGTVPYMKACLGTCLTMLGFVKTDNMKCAFSSMLCNFSEAIVEYIGNIDNAPDHNINKEFFHAEMSLAWEVLFINWLNSKDGKVKSSVAESLGMMSHVIPPDKLKDHLPKLLPALYSLYKKQCDIHIVSEALFQILKASEDEDPLLVEPFVDSLVVVLFQQVCLPVDLSSSASVKNRNAILKNFSLLAKNYPERVSGFVLGRLETANEKTRIACLDVVQHLVNYSGDSFRDKEINILSGLKMVTNDANNKVKRMLAQVVISVAQRGYLELDGGDALVEFIIKQCLLPSSPNADNTNRRSDEVTNEMLKTFCENVLFRLSSTDSGTAGILWPYLMTFLTSDSFTDACGILCKSIAAIASRKLESGDPDYYIDFEREVKVPRPSALFARLIVLLRHPRKNERGLHIINALTSLSALVRPPFVAQWNKNLQSIASKLNRDDKESEVHDGDDDVDDEWEKRLLEFLNSCLEEVDGDNWSTMCGEDFIGQIPLYSGRLQEKTFLFKCIGMALSRSSKDEFVGGSIDTLFHSTQHSVESEREACAEAVGLVACTHAGLVLDKLNAIHKSTKVSVILTFFKEALGDLDDRTKATLALSYGRLSLCAPLNFLHNHMDSSIVPIIVQNISQGRDVVVRNCVVKSIQLIGDAASKHRESPIISLTSRNTLLSHLKNLLKQESQTTLLNTSRSLIIRACSSLVKSDPVLTASEAREMFSLMASRVACLPPDPVSTADQTSPAPPDERTRHTKLLADCIDELKIFASNLIDRNPTPETFLVVFNVLHPLLISAHDHQRIRSLQILDEVNQLFIKRMNVALVEHLPHLGQITGTMVPRCSDRSVEVRLLALNCIEKLLRIGLRYEGRSPDFQDEHIDRIAVLQKTIKKVDSVAMFAVINDLSKILNKKIAGDHLYSFIEGLLEGLTDLQPHCSSAAGLTLTNLIKTRGSEFYGMVEKVFFALVLKIPDIKNPQTKTSSLRAIRCLMFHHLLKVVSVLLEEPAPFSSLTKEIWKDLGQDLQVMPSLIDHLLDMLARSQPYDESIEIKGKEKPIRRACMLPLSIMCGLTELMKAEECHVAVLQNFPQLLSQMLVQVSSMTSTRSPRTVKKNSWERSNSSSSSNVSKKNISVCPIHFAVECLRQVVVCCRHDNLTDVLDASEVWEIFSADQDDRLIEGLSIFARCLIQYQAEVVPKIISCLNPMLGSLFPPQRIMVAAMFAEFIRTKCNDDHMTVDLLMNSLVARLIDPDATVRRLCIRGLGNVAGCGQKMVQKYCTTLLSSLTGGLDDKDDSHDVIALEAMEGLSKVLRELKEADVRNVLINVALRIRPCFEKERADVRAAAITLFGDLASFGSGECKEPFLEQIHSNLVSILLHMNDHNISVREASKYSMRQVGPLLGSEKMSGVIQEHLPLNSTSLEYSSFLNSLSEAVVEDLPDKLSYFIMGGLTHFKSPCPRIRGNAATFAGCLLGNLSNDETLNMPKEQSCRALVSLMRDDEKEVRERTAAVMSLLYNV